MFAGRLKEIEISTYGEKREKFQKDLNRKSYYVVNDL